jgi:NADH-quinone oxidoreductase subunit J
MDNTILYILLGLLVFSAVLTATIKNTLKAVIALALVSSILTIIIFIMGAPLAAVFELSVCAGLVTAIFVSTISLTDAPSPEQPSEKPKKRLNRYIFLPIIVVIVIGIMFITKPALDFTSVIPALTEKTVQDTIWQTRSLDLAGIIIVILAGVFGVVVLLKEKSKN